jgi:hypothetical protein
MIMAMLYSADLAPNIEAVATVDKLMLPAALTPKAVKALIKNVGAAAVWITWKLLAEAGEERPGRLMQAMPLLARMVEQLKLRVITAFDRFGLALRPPANDLLVGNEL